MSKSGVKRFLALFFLILYGAVFLRIDYFPLSWVPMYGQRGHSEKLTVKFGDKAARKRGFEAQRANGERLYISPDDLNIPSANFRRLYNQRAFNTGPPQDRRERAALMSFNRWWYETFVGPDPRLSANYSGQLLDSVNKTFGYGPTDPRRIARLRASIDFATYSRQHVDAGDLSRPVVEPAMVTITETGTFLKRGDKVTALTGMNAPAGEGE
ncbi:MAG: hypothetical protein H0V46_00610 [Sphingomonas sp.]|nr:hypothetical protein [Sphingomonas sp.]